MQATQGKVSLPVVEAYVLSPSQAPNVKPIQETVVDPNEWGNR